MTLDLDALFAAATDDWRVAHGMAPLGFAIPQSIRKVSEQPADVDADGYEAREPRRKRDMDRFLDSPQHDQCVNGIFKE